MILKKYFNFIKQNKIFVSVRDIICIPWLDPSLHVVCTAPKVIFEASSVEVRQTLLEPNGFCRLLPLSQRILTLLHHFEEWSIFHVSGPKNRVATAIAESVVSGARTQSYVASGGPRWLDQMIQQERGV